MIFSLITAGGIGERMHANDIPKQFLLISGKPIIVYTLEKFDQCPLIDQIIIVCLKGYIEKLWGFVKQYHIAKVVAIVEGGKTRQGSIYNGLLEIRKRVVNPAKDLVLLNDAVRPVVSEKLIEDNIATAEKFGAAITVAKLIETAMIVEDGTVKEVEYRPSCRLARAPQTFAFQTIFDVYDRAEKEGKDDFLDSESMLLHYGVHPHVVECDEANFKITTHIDYVIFRSFLEAVEDSQFLDRIGDNYGKK